MNDVVNIKHKTNEKVKYELIIKDKTTQTINIVAFHTQIKSFNKKQNNQF